MRGCPQHPRPGPLRYDLIRGTASIKAEDDGADVAIYLGTLSFLWGAAYDPNTCVPTIRLAILN